MSDLAVNSLYDPVYFDGGSLASPGGIQDVRLGGPSFYSSTSGFTASTLIVLRGTPPPTGDVWIVWATGASSHLDHHTITSGDTPDSIASALAAGSIASPTARHVPVANTGYGILGVSTGPTFPPGTDTAQPYQVIINAGGLTPIGLPTVSGGCIPPGLSTAYPCWSGAFDVGDAVALRNLTRDVDLMNARFISQAGAGVHVWANGGDRIHVLHDALGADQGVNSYAGIQFDNGTTNPSNYYVAGSDFVGATNPIVNAIPTPGFVSSGAAAATRFNRGAYSYTIPRTTSSPPATSFSLQNSGPDDCIYYLTWSVAGASVATTLTLPGLGTGSTLNGLPWQIALPVGASFAATSSSGSFQVTYSGYCQP
jgi:hypothetical protein